MSKNLLIVESPAKAKTIKKYLGKDFQVLASYGHIRDLTAKEGSVDPKKKFAMRYELIEKNAKHVEAIVKAAREAEALYLATDPDREGEAISWHVCEILKERKILKNLPVHRVVFHEITKKAIREAIDHPRAVSVDLVNAQQARRALDYLVGFTLSPLLWKKIRRGLSAGRVQSPALRMIVEREEEIRKFVSQEYWTIEALLTTKKQEVHAKLIEFDGQKQQQFSITEEKQAHEVRDRVQKTANGSLVVRSVERKQKKRQPVAPFITSTLQQEAARKLGFTAQRTMRIAQQLYEGIDIGQGSVGLITYMRTDSVNLAGEAVQEIRAFILQKFGDKALPDSPRMFKTKSKNAQEAHEAIRPVSVSIEPSAIKDTLSEEQFKLYDLIWKRTVACQMMHATMDTVAVDFVCETLAVFRANGSTILDPGFLAVYQEGEDDAKKGDNEDGAILPPFTVGEKVPLKDVLCDQHFTEPPPRYSEASLIKALEEYGIGRPSTYASIISTLQNREYVSLQQKRFKPTDVGEIVNKFLTQFFTRYVDYDFTAQLEDELDEVSRGEKEWIPLLEAFWTPFVDQIGEIESTVQRKDVTQEALDESCPECQKPLSIRLGKRGKFIGCTGFPECSYTRSLENSEEGPPAAPELIEGRMCPDCNHPLQIRMGRYGKFIGCTNYPKCKHIEPLEKPQEIQVTCPECKKGHFLKRRSRYGKIFFSCSRYPDCKYAVWNEPIDQPCPQCHWPMLTHKISKRKGEEKACPQKECGYSAPLEKTSDESS